MRRLPAHRAVADLTTAIDVRQSLGKVLFPFLEENAVRNWGDFDPEDPRRQTFAELNDTPERGEEFAESEFKAPLVLGFARQSLAALAKLAGTENPTPRQLSDWAKAAPRSARAQPHGHLLQFGASAPLSRHIHPNLHVTDVRPCRAPQAPAGPVETSECLICGRPYPKGSWGNCACGERLVPIDIVREVRAERAEKAAAASGACAPRAPPRARRVPAPPPVAAETVSNSVVGYGSFGQPKARHCRRATVVSCDWLSERDFPRRERLDAHPPARPLL